RARVWSDPVAVEELLDETVVHHLAVGFRHDVGELFVLGESKRQGAGVQSGNGGGEPAVFLVEAGDGLDDRHAVDLTGRQRLEGVGVGEGGVDVERFQTGFDQVVVDCSDRIELIAGSLDTDGEAGQV